MRKMMTMIMVALLAVGMLGLGSRARAQDQQDVTVPVPWVSDITGKADSLMIKQSDTDWFEATENTPLGEGDMVWQDKGGESEIYMGDGSYLRLGEDSGVQFTKLANDQVRVTLTKGKVLAASAGEPLLLDIPGQTVVLNAGDRARVDVADDGASRVTASGGKVEVDGPRGRFNLGPGQTLTANASGDSVQLVRSAQRDSFDRWSDQRDAALAAAAPPAAASYIPAPAAVAMADNGVWVNDPTYGYVWRPAVAVGWIPYRDGRWVWRPAWGWTWVSYEPWGWYPYHYGRWVLLSGGWVWSPVHIVTTVWSPALVFWLEGPDYIAWQPIPYSVVSVGLFFNFGPTYYDRYIDHRCLTVVRYNDFGRGHYGNYARPWPGNCGSSCRVVRDPYREISRHLNVDHDSRTPRSNGYVSRDRRPSDNRVYAHNPSDPRTNDKHVARVDYGSRNTVPHGMDNRNNDVRNNPRGMTGNNRPDTNNGRAGHGETTHPTVNGRGSANTNDRAHPTIPTRETGNRGNSGTDRSHPTVNNRGTSSNPGNGADSAHPTVPSNRSYGYRTGDNNREAPRGGQKPAVNNGNNGTRAPEPKPATNYQYRNGGNTNTGHGPTTNVGLPGNYGRDERGNLVKVPAQPDTGARAGHGETTRPVTRDTAFNGGQRPSTHYGYNGDTGARGNINTSHPTTNNVPSARPAPRTTQPSAGYNTARPTTPARTSSAPPANTNVNRSAPSRSSNAAPRAAAPAPSNNTPTRGTPAPSYNNNRSSSSRSSAPAQSSSSTRASGGGSQGGRSGGRH